MRIDSTLFRNFDHTHLATNQNVAGNIIWTIIINDGRRDSFTIIFARLHQYSLPFLEY